MLITHVWIGRFRSPNSTELLASVSGCEPANRDAGGGYLLSQEPLRVIWYRDGLTTNNCAKISFKDGRDGLVCYRDGCHSGMCWQGLYTIDLRLPEGQGRPLFIAEDFGPCGLGRGVAREAIQSATLDGNTITVLMTRGEHLTQAICDKAGTLGNLDQLAPAKQYRLTFVFNGEDFRAASESVVAPRKK